MFQLFDFYLGSRILLIIAFFECIAISYFYGMSGRIVYKLLLRSRTPATVTSSFILRANGSLLQCIYPVCLAGARKFYDNLRVMLGFDITPFMMLSWAVVTPLFTFVSSLC